MISGCVWPQGLSQFLWMDWGILLFHTNPHLFCWPNHQYKSLPSSKLHQERLSQIEVGTLVSNKHDDFQALLISCIPASILFNLSTTPSKYVGTFNSVTALVIPWTPCSKEKSISRSTPCAYGAYLFHQQVHQLWMCCTALLRSMTPLILPFPSCFWTRHPWIKDIFLNFLIGIS